MVVNSINFLIFFVVVFTVYYLPICGKAPRFQNLWLLLTSYFFYGFADWKMVPLLLGANIVFFCIGLWLKSEMEKGHVKNASNITTLGVLLGVGVLLYFKYLNFFAESFAQLLGAIGLTVSWTTLNIVLPIGVSFFTFKLISYVIEIHREHIQPSKDIVEFGTYIAFFPTLLSGPIDRPNSFLPQLWVVRRFNYDLAVDGCRQILWGMFTKICIADNLAILTDETWNNIAGSNGSTLLLSALLYPIQMYADFDGYSNMAIGVGKLLGINVTKNFNHPFLARNIAEYWRNWHISLTGWLTDYVFQPLNIAFRYIGHFGIIYAVIINFLLIGLWHGANLTFLLFGLYHGVLYVPLILSGSYIRRKKLQPNKYHLPKLKDFVNMASTFFMVSIGLILFRASTVKQAYEFIYSLINSSILIIPNDPLTFLKLLVICLVYLLIEWVQRKKDHDLDISFKSPILRYVIYFIVFFLTISGSGNPKTFIYLQF